MMAGYSVRVTSGRAVRLTACATAALAGLAVAVVAGAHARAMDTAPPTRAELSAAAAVGIAQRWERLPAGAIFPATIGYTSDLSTRETASRVGIDPADGCATAVDGTLRALAARDGCVAGVRADYTDELRGSVYTIGVLAFASAVRASGFYATLPRGGYPATGLRAFAVPGTPAALFDDGARQVSAAKRAGPYVVLAVAGYSDGRPASAAQERRTSVFHPLSQLVSAVAAPLDKPLTVRCDTAEWACGTLRGPRAALPASSAGNSRAGVPGSVPVPPSSLAQIRPAELRALDQIDAPAAWRTALGAGVTVAVLDTGVDPATPDLAGSVTTGPDYTAGADPAGYHPPLLHGTYIASLIAAHGSGRDDQFGVIGVAPRAKILSVRVILDDSEPGTTAYDDNSRFANAIGKGIYYAVAHGAQVINMSLGSQQATAYMRTAVAYALAKGVVIVASAGNNGTVSGFDPYVYPASFTGVIAVAAVTGAGTRASFSEQNAAVVLSAPGVDVVGAGPAGEYLDAEGTSPAAALVSGVAALIKSRYPGLSPALVQQALITSATRRPASGYSTGTGFGEVDAVTALAAAARLAAQRPSAGLAPGALFASLGTPGAAGTARTATARIQVVHRDTAAIDGYTAVAGAGALCFLAALVLLPVLARRPAGSGGNDPPTRPC
jgi:subtilisin family serine protease